ncbi:GNAT family N-acetyltransferase [Curtobacterium sp. VKM Ac-2922]|uniref:GNAT family N-acetyltransferase n=1 Tax=Curtobacterium sp. VKM Ac-2922 TaxID=2929475 RepID=UPI001FB4FDE8|nr:GNAT family N-acetyltransferase [Curtobacterium sp. VKM Ac-2922]MCJ1714973.1 GNAT family N-acetyltransferase [Curtobacterium sp. VKM Ac-2922]
MGETIVVPAQSVEHITRESQGWVVVARSFGAHLDAARIDRPRFRQLVADAVCTVRELGPADVDAVLRLDRATIGDYPGSVATQHTPLDQRSATPSASRRAFGAVEADGELVAMTYVDVDVDQTRRRAETDFTVVHRDWRGRGLGTAVKAASLLALLDDGVVRFRTGGSMDNAAILAAGDTLGYVRDEEWVTLEDHAT